jgi:hypothetical protein
MRVSLATLCRRDKRGGDDADTASRTHTQLPKEIE